MEERAHEHEETPDDSEREEELRVFARLLGDAPEAPEPPVSAPPVEAPAPAPTAKPTDVPELVARRYEIRLVLDDGPRGRVYLVRDHDRQGREMALELLRGDAVIEAGFPARLHEYVDRLRALAGDAIIRPRDAGRTERGVPYITRDLVRGENLRQILERKGVVSPRRAFEIARQILQGLERVHRAGLAHGGLDPQSVMLEERAPCTETNPFGVAVRLLDVGLTGLLRSADEAAPSMAGDLHDTGSLLVELLLGSRPSTEAGGWAGSSHAPGTAGLSRRAQRVIDTALTSDATARFPSAHAFRLAIEATPEWQPERARRRHMTTLYAVLALLAVAVFVVWWQAGERTVVAAVEPDEPSDTSPTREELETLQQTSEAREAELESQLDAADGELESAQRDREEERERAAEAERERDEARARLAREEEERLLLEARLESARKQAEALEAARVEAQRAADPAFVTARGADQILDRVAEGKGREARALLLALKEDSVLEGASIAGGGLLDALTAAAEAREQATQAAHGLDAVATLEKAEERAAAARVRRQNFDAAAASWLNTPLADGTVPDRLAELDRVLDGQRRALDATAADVTASLEARWRTLRGGDPDVEPAELLALAAHFDDGRLADFLARYAQHVRRVAEGAEGTLELAGLAGVDSLDAWADVVAANEKLADSHAGREVLLHRYARAWYEPATADETAPAGPVVFQGSREGEPPTGWREDLAIRTMLVDEEAPYPGPPGTLAVYRAVTPEGTESWQVIHVLEDPDPPPEASWSRVVEERFYDADGIRRGHRQLRIALQGKRFFQEDARRVEVLDLGRRQPGLALASWEPDLTLELPERLPIRREDLVAFRKRLAEDPDRRCLVKQLGSKATWYSADFGLVRHEEPGRITRELIFASLPR